MNNSVSLKTKNMVYIGMFSIIIAICSWISIPTAVPFTMQTFGIFCALGLLGGKKGTISVLIYCALGIIGIPVFAGFSSGIGVLLGNTGGYIIGFVLSGLVYWLFTKMLGNRVWAMFLSMFLGLIACYVVGTIWFMMVYTSTTGNVGVYAVLSWCVFPFIIPDLIKILLSILIVKRVGKYVKL